MRKKSAAGQANLHRGFRFVAIKFFYQRKHLKVLAEATRLLGKLFKKAEVYALVAYLDYFHLYGVADVYYVLYLFHTLI